ncbi:MAG: redoxin domain-containing protein [Thermomicrobiales bacterium]
MVAWTEAETGLRIGELIPSFSGCTLDGRTIERRQYKGRRHLVLIFTHGVACAGCRALLAALARDYGAFRAEGAEVLAFVPAETVAGADAPNVPFPVLASPPALYASFGALAGGEAVWPALYLADRYGEVVWRALADQDGGHTLPVDEVVPLVERMAMVCAL